LDGLVRRIYTIESLEARASSGTETSEAELRDTSPKVKWVMTATSQRLHMAMRCILILVEKVPAWAGTADDIIRMLI
jgi:hypothetical protein